MKNILFYLLLISSSSFSAVLDEQWNDWYGTSTLLGTEISVNNSNNERLSLSCIDNKFSVTVTNLYSNDEYGSDSTVNNMYLIIDDKEFPFYNDPSPKDESPDNDLYKKLKTISPTSKLIFHSKQFISEPFSTNGLKDALIENPFEDCF